MTTRSSTMRAIGTSPAGEALARFPHGRERTPTYRMAASVCMPLMRLLFRPVVSGIEHLPAESGFVLCANQTSNLDGFALAYAIQPSHPCWMGKSELFNRITDGFLRRMGIFPVRRGAADTEALGIAVALTRRGGVVGIFPEGTRRQKGLGKRHTARPHSGAARVALEAGVPVVPAAIRGTERLLAFRQWYVAFGPPIDAADLGDRARPRDLTTKVWDAIHELESELWKG